MSLPSLKVSLVLISQSSEARADPCHSFACISNCYLLNCPETFTEDGKNISVEGTMKFP